MVSLSTAESELHSEGLGREGPGDGMPTESTLVASATMCLVNRKGLGKAQHVNVQHHWIEEASKSEKFVLPESVHVRESRRLDDETTAKAQN